MRHRSTKAERLTLQLAERILANPTATPAELSKALRALGRQKPKPVEPEPAEPEPSIDELVKEMEKRAVPAPLKLPEIAVSAPIQFAPTNTPSQKNKGLQTPLIERAENEPLIQKDLAEASNRSEMGCPVQPADIFQPARPDEARARLAKAAWYSQTGSTIPPADGLSDLQRSQRLWQEQEWSEQDERAHLAREIEYQSRKEQF
jgi:hypothetical protein